MGKLTDILFPDLCVLCGTTVRARNASLTCSYCWADLPWLTASCRHCALPLGDQGICGSCLTQPLVRGLAVVPLRHETEAQYLIAQLKFHKGYREAKTLAACMAKQIDLTYGETPKPSALVATPLSYLSLLRRGYNQSALLAQTLAKALDIDLIAPITKKQTPPQRKMSRQER
ncbi:MAG: putative amidophosphoribosyltransferase, partial [Candidatus Azotimanducaceae bacterium]